MRYVIVFSVLLLLSSCENNPNDIVPYVSVNLTLGVYSELNGLGVGEVVTITPDTLNNGYSWVKYASSSLKDRRIPQKTYGNGILIYQKDFYDYRAYDLTCTYRARIDYCALITKGRSILPVCKCCGSVFNLEIDGTPAKNAKATYNLRSYRATLVDNQTKLIVTNL